MKVLGAIAAVAAVTSPVVADEWDTLREGLTAWRALNLDINFAIDIGTVDGQKFYFQSDPARFGPHTSMLGASFSKWTTSAMIGGLVKDGILAFDDKANKYLDFWATDPKDPRSAVTIESLLSLTSGFQVDASPVCGFGKDYLTCAEEMYNNTTKYTTPRTVWTYLSCHHQFAGAVAVAASKMTMHDLFKKYLYEPFGMTNTFYEPPNFPLMAAGIVTNGNDVASFLKGMLDYSGLPKTVMDQIETDWTQPPVNLAPRGNYFGHYGMGHMWECFGYAVSNEKIALPLPDDCTAHHIHSGPGDFGLYPLIDRSTGGGLAGPVRPQHYFALDINEAFNTSGIPEYLRIITKPVSDLILNGTEPSTVKNSELLAAGGGILRRDIVYIQSELKSCNCTGAPTAKGEPFASLLKNQPADVRTQYRGDMLRAGQGVSLLDIIAIQKNLGTCTCAGRHIGPSDEKVVEE